MNCDVINTQRNQQVELKSVVLSDWRRLQFESNKRHLIYRVNLGIFDP